MSLARERHPFIRLLQNWYDLNRQKWREFVEKEKTSPEGYGSTPKLALTVANNELYFQKFESTAAI